MRNFHCAIRVGRLFPLIAGILFWSALLTTLHAEYQYPIGIPTAWIEPDVPRPAEPADWSNEVPGYYYVDEATGTDSKRPYGTPSAPRKTIPSNAGTALPAGSYVKVVGTYTYAPGGISVLNAAGTKDPWIAGESGPVWIVGQNADSRASFKGRILFKGSYLCCEFLDNLAGNSVWQFSSVNQSLNYTADHMLVRNCKVEGLQSNPTTAVAVYSGPVRSNHIVFFRNEISGFGPSTPADKDVDAAGFMVVDLAHDIWALDNKIHDMSGTGMMIAGRNSGPSETSRIYFGRNEVYNTWAAGIACKTSDHVVWSENIVHDVKWTSWSSKKGFGAQYSVESLWLINNIVYNCDYGFKMASGSGGDIYVVGNVFYNIQDDPNGQYVNGSVYSTAAVSIWSGSNRFVVGNTMVDCKRGVCVTTASEDRTTVIENNIISGSADEDIWVELGSAFVEVRNNLLYREDGDPGIKLGAMSSVAVANQSSSKVSGNIVGDPEFKNVSEGDFTVTESSPAKGSGLSPSNLDFDVYSEYFKTFGISIGGITAQGGVESGPWDIGAMNSMNVDIEPKPLPSVPKGIHVKKPAK